MDNNQRGFRDNQGGVCDNDLQRSTLDEEDREGRSILLFFVVSFVAWLAMVVFARKVLSGEVVTVANGGPAGRYCAFPGACKLSDGRILCVYYNGTGHVTTTKDRPGGGAIAYVLSGDDGKTWGKPGLLVDTDMDDRDPNVSVLRDGRIVLNWFRHPGDGIYVHTLSVKGDTISPADNSRKIFHDAGTGGAVRDMGNGLLLMGAYHVDQPYVLRSPDNGKIWQVAAPYNSGKHLDAETDVIKTRDGYLAVFRGNGCNGHYSTSPDGIRWSDAADIGFPLHSPDLCRVGDSIVMAHRCPATAYHISRDEGKTWDGPYRVDSCGGAYPAIVAVSDTEALIVYYTEGTESDIRCRVVDIGKPGV